MSPNAAMHNGYMVFDVESIGLHGDGFAVGILVVDRNGVELLATRFVCPSERAKGGDEDRCWVRQNVPPMKVNCADPREVRDSFWRLWEHYSAKHVLLAADNGWPVEARFLIACVDDDLPRRKETGPHPLVDIGSVILALDPDLQLDYGRAPDELPEHDPLADARRSTRLLLTCLLRAT